MFAPGAMCGDRQTDRDGQSDRETESQSQKSETQREWNGLRAVCFVKGAEFVVGFVFCGRRKNVAMMAFSFESHIVRFSLLLCSVIFALPFFSVMSVSSSRAIRLLLCRSVR
jgi:hypothetical protein